MFIGLLFVLPFVLPLAVAERTLDWVAEYVVMPDAEPVDAAIIESGAVTVPDAAVVP